MESKAVLGTDRAIIGGVTAEFFALCRYPHSPWHEGALADYLSARLRELGAVVRRDAHDNLLADFSPTEGMEGLPLLVFQGHMDMVCAVAPGSGYVPERDPIAAAVKDGMLRSDGRSSLGADCNLGNAAVLYLLSRALPHGPLRFLLTVAEETGLQGAKLVEAPWLSGVKYLVNTDGFKLGRAVISSAGGRRESYTRKLTTTLRKGAIAFEISLTGFLGGHSGYDINKGRGNAIKLLALFLGELRESVDYDLADLEGGHAHNAIPQQARAVITAHRAFAPAVAHAVEHLRGSLSKILRKTDPGVRVSLREVPPPERVWSHAARDGTLDLISLLYNGVFAMRDDMPGQVSASCNVGRVLVNDEHQIEVDCFIRCAVDFNEEILAFQHARAARLTGFKCAASGYPGWMGDAENPLARLMARVYRRQTGGELEIAAVHVGLEPSVLGALNPEMVMVSTGPDILFPHSTEERAPVASLPPYVRLLAGTLTEIGKQGG